MSHTGLTEEQLEYLQFENIEFIYEAIYQHDETRKVFEKFLGEILATEQRSFIEKANELLQQSDPKICLEMLCKIRDVHFDVYSKEAINVSKDELKLVELLLKETPSVEHIHKVITTISNQILLTWKEDVFPRFVRSKTLKQWYHRLVKTKSPLEACTLLRQISILHRLKNEKRPADIFFSDEEFCGTPRCITKKEIDFCESLIEDAPYWKLLYADKHGCSVFKGLKPFVTNMKSIKANKYSLTKFTCYLPFDIYTVVATIFSNFKNGDPNVVHTEQLSYLTPNSEEEYFSTVICNQVHIGKLFQKRAVMDTIAGYYNPTLNLYGMPFRTFDEYADTYLPHHVKMHGVGCYYFAPVDSNQCKMTVVMLVDMGGYAQKIVKFSDGVSVKRCQTIQQQMIKACEAHVAKCDASKTNATWYHQDDIGVLNTLEDNCKQRVSKEQMPPLLNNEQQQYYPDKRATKINLLK